MLHIRKQLAFASINCDVVSNSGPSKTTIHRVVRLGGTIYGPQTKILEDGTKDEMRIFEVLFNGS